MKKVLIDRFIPFSGDPFEGIAEIERLDPGEFTPDRVRDADALIVRTRTRCGAPLLEGSKVGIVATATIGTDHFDLPWLAANGIKAVSAPGCNAPAVAQYVLSSILTLGLGQPGMRLGVIGVGHVGSIVARWAQALGMELLLCDPPRQRAQGGWDSADPAAVGDRPFLSAAEVARKADVLTLHTPLIRQGEDATLHLVDRELIDLAPKALLINAARGPVTDTAALIPALKKGWIRQGAIDCWEGEPSISTDLLRLADISTPHIAGYSIEGKARATAATFNAVLEYLGSDRRVDPGVSMTPPEAPSAAEITASYDPLADSLALKSDPARFEHLRDSYRLRHEVK